MKIQESPLKLKDFLLLNSEFVFLADDKSGEEIVKSFDEYYIDVNFGTAQEVSDFDFIRLFMKIEINRIDPKKAGYSILAEGVGIFSIAKDLPSDDKNSLLNYSAISMVMNALRGYISNMTAYAPLGKYLLPSVDVNRLIKDKQVEMQELEKSKNSPPQ